MNLSEQFQLRLQQHIDLLADCQETLQRPLVDAAESIVGRLLEGGKLLSCGNGSNALLAQQLSLAMAHRFDRDRPGLPALALPADTAMLTGIAADSDFDEIYARQIHALGHPGDILFCLSLEGGCDNLEAAIAAAREREIQTILLSGNEGGRLRRQLHDSDIALCIPGQSAPRILEMQLLCINNICELIDLQLLGN